MSNWHDACDLIKSATSHLPTGWKQGTTSLPPGVKKMKDEKFRVLVEAGNPVWRREFAKDIDEPKKEKLKSPTPSLQKVSGKTKGTEGKIKRLSGQGAIRYVE